MKYDFDRHFYLYAKGHYKRTDVIGDLKTLINKRSNIDKCYITEKEIMEVLLPLVYKHIDSYQKFFNLFQMIFFSPFLLETESDNISMIIAIHNFLSVLGYVKVRDENHNIILDLGEADSNILPLKNQED